MKCRNVFNGNIVWFNSIGKDNNGKRISYDGEYPENYLEDTNAVVVSLEQRLSVIKGELWYQINFGVPLLEKHRSKATLDAAILEIISKHPGVASITSYNSTVKDKVYSFNAQIITIYGDNLNIEQSKDM